MCEFSPCGDDQQFSRLVGSPYGINR
jgi:hypothetical protein